MIAWDLLLPGAAISWATVTVYWKTLSAPVGRDGYQWPGFWFAVLTFVGIALFLSGLLGREWRTIRRYKKGQIAADQQH
jgi:hypothetical protein